MAALHKIILAILIKLASSDVHSHKRLGIGCLKHFSCTYTRSGLHT